jgi:hypothetical protein
MQRRIRRLSLKRLRPRSSRGATELAVAIVALALVAGGLLGAGLADTTLVASDGLTWLTDDGRGEVTQVNPATGKPEVRLKVAPPGNALEISQREGLLVVTDTITGLVTVIDVATLITSGRHRGSGDGATKVLLGAERLYVVDRVRGTVRQLDPATAADVGRPWSSGVPLADAALDSTGTVWALGADGLLHTLTWSVAQNRFVELSAPRPVAGAGPNSVMVGHDRGVTVFAPEGGVVVRVGTEHDNTLAAPDLADELHPALVSPTDLVPASVANSPTVVVVNGDRVLHVDVGRFGCQRPGEPVVFGNRIYVACRDSRKVIVLSREGGHLPPDIPVPEGEDPLLEVDDGRLIINVPGASTGVVVERDGSTHPIITHDESVPVEDPGNRPPPVVPTPPPPRPRQPEQTNPSSTGGGGQPGGGESGSGQPGTGSPTATATAGPSTPAGAPNSVSAQARGDRTVLVGWQHTARRPDRFRVLRGDNSAQVADVPGDATSAVVTTVAAGTDVAFVVEAVYAGESFFSTPSNVVTVYTAPDAPGGVNVSYVSDTGTTITVDVTWSAPGANGSAITGYEVTVNGQRRQVASPGSVRVTVDCQGACWSVRVDASVTASNGAGAGPAGTGRYTHQAPPAAPGNGDTVITGWEEIPTCSGSGCRIVRYRVKLYMSPPAPWRDFTGTCAIRRNAGGVITDTPISCATTSYQLIGTEGDTHTFTVRACAASCVTSNSVQVTTSMPESGEWCGTVRC